MLFSEKVSKFFMESKNQLTVLKKTFNKSSGVKYQIGELEMRIDSMNKSQ